MRAQAPWAMSEARRLDGIAPRPWEVPTIWSRRMPPRMVKTKGSENTVCFGRCEEATAIRFSKTRRFSKTGFRKPSAQPFLKPGCPIHRGVFRFLKKPLSSAGPRDWDMVPFLSQRLLVFFTDRAPRDRLFVWSGRGVNTPEAPLEGPTLPGQCPPGLFSAQRCD